MVVCSRGSLRAVLLVAVVLLAGCSGLPAADSQSGSDTTVADFSYPAGWSQAGITDARNLTVAMRTHDETVENVSRTSRLAVVQGGENRTMVRTVDTDAGTGSLRFIDTELGFDVHTYYSPEGVFEYDRTTGELTRMPGENWTIEGVATQPGLERPLRHLELNAVETVTVGGDAAVRYNVTGIRNPDRVPSNTASGHVTVAEAGYVSEYDVTRGNDAFTRRTRYNLSELGNATVTRPAWLPEE